MKAASGKITLTVFIALAFLLQPISAFALIGEQQTQEAGTSEDLQRFSRPAGFAPQVKKTKDEHVTKMHPAARTASQRIYNERFDLLPVCPTNPSNCPDINSRRGSSVNCPNVCKMSRVDGSWNSARGAPSSINSVICPPGYAQMSSFDARPEYKYEPNSTLMPYPINNWSTWLSYYYNGSDYWCATTLVEYQNKCGRGPNTQPYFAVWGMHFSYSYWGSYAGMYNCSFGSCVNSTRYYRYSYKQCWNPGNTTCSGAPDRPYVPSVPWESADYCDGDNYYLWRVPLYYYRCYLRPGLKATSRDIPGSVVCGRVKNEWN